ncbi:ABC-2 type transporter [Desulforamulus reducens MI-1]|uniref:Transport permease protein n=1 Tax=Desulforamulus reducens (strain ATCC BAA-1160 / DSM 100696 / MI-1) TaxID=349161 RepID=A4J981_DESRM|nr:ABC transporter permease [Desulforamulus reducens]ABO51634.1 ABC-2 type transporter [Desulforamulus reducens MI-1]
MSNYFQRVWAARYFFTHLALSDLRSRWRRSFFGILWSIIQPLGMTALLSIVFSKIFHTEIREYAPYILSGMVLWDFVIATAIGGALSFVQADAYIKQCRHPLAIYTLRTTLTNLMVLMLSSISLVLWVLVVMPKNFGWTWLAALSIYPIVALIVWPLATALAYIAVRFRDLPHALGLIFQAMWFVSPIYFEDKIFRNGDLHALIDYNPIYHLLELVRAPLLHGKWPTFENYAYCLGTMLVFSFLAWIVGRRAEERVIFYL